MCYLSRNSMYSLCRHHMRHVSWHTLIFVEKKHEKLQKYMISSTHIVIRFLKDCFTIFSILFVFKLSLEAKNSGFSVKWAKTRLASNNMTSFTITANISKLFSSGSTYESDNMTYAVFSMEPRQPSAQSIYPDKFIILQLVLIYHH